MKTNINFLTAVAALALATFLPLTVCGQVYNSTSSAYEDETPLHLLTLEEGRSYMPGAGWWYENFHPDFPVTFNLNRNPVDSTTHIVSGNQTVLIAPMLFATTKVGSYVSIRLRRNDDTDTTVTSLCRTMGLYSAVNSWDKTPSYYYDRDMLFPGSGDLHYYPNRNTLSGSKGSYTMSLGAGSLRFGVTTDILSRLQSTGLIFSGTNYTLLGTSVIDPFAVFPGKGSTTTLTVPVREKYDSLKTSENTGGGWWQNAIVLDQSLFANAQAGDVIHVYTSKAPDDTTSVSPYTGYPTVGTAEDNGANNTSQVYLQCFTGTTANPGNGEQRYIDRGWDYMNTDAYFVLSDDDISQIKDDNHVTQLIINGGTIRKVSIDPAWSDSLTFQLSSTEKSMPDGTAFPVDTELTDSVSGSETGGDGTTTGDSQSTTTSDDYTYTIYLENLRSLQPQTGDIIRLSLAQNSQHNTTEGQRPLIGVDYYGTNNGGNVTWSMRGNTTANRTRSVPDGFGHTGVDISKEDMSVSFKLDDADIAAINNSDHTGDETYSDAAKNDHYYWLAIKAMGMTISGAYLDKQVTPRHHIVELSEDDTVTCLRSETNVDVHLKRKLTPGQWATIMLPFNLTAEQARATFGPHVSLGHFDQSSEVKDDSGNNYWSGGDYEKDYEGKEYVLVRCTPDTVVYANMPMMIYFSKTDSATYYRNPAKGEYYEFKNIDLTLRNSFNTASNAYGNGYIQHSPLFMVGNYSVIPKLPKYAIYLKTKENPHHPGQIRQDFYYVGRNTIKNGGIKMKGYRWYMYFSSDNSSLNMDTYKSYYTKDGTFTGAAKIRFMIGDEDITGNLDPTATVISTVDSTADDQPSPVYSLTGCRVASSLKEKALAPGIYIVSGRKIIIK